jgi:uncharacterized protein (DUF4415 family)
MSEERTGTVSFTLDPLNPPTLTAEQEARLRAMSDDDIDLSDMPERDMSGWKRPGRVAEKALQEKILMLDPDVIDLFQQVEDASPAKMNAVLREYAVTHRKSA